MRGLSGDRACRDHTTRAIVGRTLHAERGSDERGVCLHVRAHHDDVPQLEGRVVGEEAEQHLAEYLDLSVPAVARMHPDAGVVAAEHVRAGGGLVCMEIALESCKQGVWGGRCFEVLVGVNHGVPAEPELHLAGVTPQ